MTEKVLGFKEKDAVITALDTHFREGYFIDKRIKLVPVVSVEFLKDSVKWLEGTSYDKYRREGRDFDEGYIQAFEDLLSVVKKEVETK